jgi:carbon-monoxide dehydrogenase medium subunit
MASTAAVLVMDGETCREAAIALGAVAPVPIVAAAAGEALVGKKLTEESLDEAADLASEASSPIDDIRATREYRLELVRVLTRRVLRRAVERVQWNE